MQVNSEIIDLMVHVKYIIQIHIMKAMQLIIKPKELGCIVISNRIVIMQENGKRIERMVGVKKYIIQIDHSIMDSLAMESKKELGLLDSVLINIILVISEIISSMELVNMWIRSLIKNILDYLKIIKWLLIVI